MDRWEVPYTTATGARGAVRVLAESAAEAAQRAAEIHMRGRYPVTPTLGWAGPGAAYNSRGNSVSRRLLSKAERAGFAYGDPVPVTPTSVSWAVAS